MTQRSQKFHNYPTNKYGIYSNFIIVYLKRDFFQIARGAK